MITPEQFTREIIKLQEQFGQGKFSQRKNELIYKAVKHLKMDELCYVVDNLIGNSKFAPTLDDFRVLTAKYKRDAAEENKIDCSTCKSTGIVIVRKKTGEIGEYAFRCDCENGNMYQAYPQWKSYLQKEYTRQIVPMALTDKFYGREPKEIK